MSDSLLGRIDAFLSFYRETVLPVFRYHLARCGDWQEAQALTRETFRRAFTWFDRALVANGQALPWLFGIAVYVQMRVRRSVDPADSAAGSAMPLQEQVAAFVKVADVAEAWNRLPSRMADALALFIFAGLELDVVAQVVGWSSFELQTRLARIIDDQAAQRLLVASLQPVGYFSAHLEAELRELAHLGGRLHRQGAGPTGWRLAYRSSQQLGRSARILPLLIAILFFLGAVWFLSSPPAAPRAAPTPTAAVSPLGQFPYTSDSAILADAQGQIFSYGLSSYLKTPLSPQGFYAPSGPGAPPLPQVSPDGRWLVVVNALDQSTWLLALDGSGGQRVERRPVELAWARDAQTALYVDPQHPMLLNAYRVAQDAHDVLAALPGAVLTVAVAPDGLHAAVLYQLPRLAADTPENELALVDLRSGQGEALAHFQDAAALGSRHTLVWSDDGSEIWYPRYRAALRLADRKLHPLVSKPPYDPTVRPTFLNLILHPAVAQPFLDRFGLEALLLDETDPRSNNLLTLGAIAPGYSSVALAYYNSQGVTGSLALEQVPDLENRAWSANFSSIGQIAWTKEGNELLVAEKEDAPGRLWWVLARDGQHQELFQDVTLLGTVSGLQRRSLLRAPGATLIPGSARRSVQGQMEVAHSGLGLRFSAPGDWKVWSFADERAWGSLVVANFDLQGPFGFASLGPEQLMVMIGPLAWQDQRPLADWLAQLVQRSGGAARYTAETLDGLPAYRLEYTLPDQSVEQMVLVQTGRGVIGISMIPTDSLLVDEFDRMLGSLHFE